MGEPLLRAVAAALQHADMPRATLDRALAVFALRHTRPLAQCALPPAR
jgi:hypothetical protein